MDGRAGSLRALMIAEAVFVAGVMAGHNHFGLYYRRWALIAFAFAWALAAVAMLIAWRRTPRGASVGAAAIEDPKDQQSLEFLLAVVSVIASVIGAIASGLGLG